VTRAVIAALLRFQVVCADLGVPGNRIRIIATEATRTAINSAEYCKAIKDATGMTVEMLPKEQEGRVGALGIASSFSDVNGLVMDLGGGSMQITWMVAREGNLEISPKGSYSFPYGAAALTRKLDELKAGKSKDDAKKATDQFREEMIANFRDAYHGLEIPEDLVENAKSQGGFPLYLSGGGFRGWGYLLLYQNQVHGRHYPISIINGLRVGKESFEDTETLKEVARSANRIFRVSDRRRAQAPAVAFLVNVLTEALPHGIRDVRFCQGGVREGVLFQELPPSIRREDPLEVATSLYARPSAWLIGELLTASIPPTSEDEARSFPPSISRHVINSLANVLFVHSDMAKESASATALYSTSTGILASSHGVSHIDRALLALMFEERFDGELPPREMDFKTTLRQLLTPEQIWWTRYLGKVAMLIARMYPAGIIMEDKPRVKISAKWAVGLGKQGNKDGLMLRFAISKRDSDTFLLKETMDEFVEVIEKVGKRKNWIGGKEGWGMKVKIKVAEEDWGDDGWTLTS
jgi:retrograde regulation protein 2